MNAAKDDELTPMTKSSARAQQPTSGLAPDQTEMVGRRVCVLVLGMHRAGTSALTRMLSLLGARLPKHLLGENPSNPTGHWEPQKILEINDRILEALSSRWDDWRGVDIAMLEAHQLSAFREEIKAILLSEYGNAPLFVVKDPRICRLVPLYQSVLAEMDIAPCYVVPTRNPLSVMESLQARNGTTTPFVSLLWLRHVLDAEFATRGKRRSILSYEALMRDWRLVAGRIASELALDWPIPVEEAATDIVAFLRPEMQHHASGLTDVRTDPIIEGWVRNAYAAMTELDQPGPESEAALKALDRVRREFDKFATVFGAATFPEIAAREKKALAVQQNLTARAEQGEHGNVLLRQNITLLEAEVATQRTRALESEGAVHEATMLRSQLEGIEARRLALEKIQVAQADELIRAQRLAHDLGRGLTEAKMLLENVRQKNMALESTATAAVQRQSDDAAESRHLKQKTEVLFAEQQRLTVDRDHARSNERQARAALDAVYESTSWRITYPLRQLKRLLNAASRSQKRN